MHNDGAVVLFWENFGPTHVDRLDAVRQAVGERVVGLEFRRRSAVYAWDLAPAGCRRQTLFEGAEPGWWRRLAALWRAVRRIGRGHYFLCHYDWPEVMMLAVLLRFSGSTVVAMLDAKFDDRPRSARWEWLKSFALAPYSGAIAPAGRSARYAAFLGIAADAVRSPYDVVGIARLRRAAGVAAGPAVETHAQRDFICIARLVARKNHATLLAAYGVYAAATLAPRPLHLCGDGPLEAALRAQVQALGLDDLVRFHGFVQAEALAKMLGRSLALLLPSHEEQFGLAIIEALGLGVPVIVSDQCGARDSMVRSGVNGFLVEPDNAPGLVQFMILLDRDAALWNRMAQSAYADAGRGDVAHFVEAVRWHLEH